MGLTAIGNVIWATQQFLGGQPDYSWSNIPSLLSYPFAVAGLLSLPIGKPGPGDRLRLAIDAAVALVAGAVITWLLVIVPLARSDSQPMHMVISLLCPIGDLVMFAALMPLLLTSRGDRSGVLPLFVVGQSVYLLGDLSYQLVGRVFDLHGFVWPNIPYLAGYVLMVWSAEGYRRLPVARRNEDPLIETAAQRNPVPLILGAAVFYLLFTAGETSTSGHRLLAIGAVVTTALLLLREAVTERQNRSLRLALDERRVTERLAATIQHLRIGIVIYNREGTIIAANQVALDIFAVTDAELRGRRVLDLHRRFTTEDGQVVTADTAPAEVARRTGMPVRNVMIAVENPETGARQWHLVDAEPELDEQGGVTRVLVSLHDMTERRELETQLRQAQRMEAVGQLAGGVAHDFNNLLTAITGYSSTLMEQLPPGPLRDDVAEIDKAASRAADLTRRLLAFGRRQLLQPRVVEVDAVVNGADRLLRRLLREDIEIVVDLQTSSLVLVDRGQLEQVIINLAVNARDAMPRGGRLTISVRDVHARPSEMPAASAFPPEGAVLLEVRDNGVGMDPATLARAFEPFFTTKEVGKGTGLGLATVYGIVHQSGGETWIQSRPGSGTTVSVLLPRTGQQVVRTPETTPVLKVRGSETILAVEDEPSLLLVLRRSLERQGYTVLTASSVARAQEVLREARVDLLLSDVVMAGGGGPELARWARERNPTLPVIFITGYADETVLQAAADLHHNGIILKPFKPAQLVTRVREVLDGLETSA
jgi:PAS domain S-box-containing protein